MNRTEAHELLDAAKAGIDVETRKITAALRATGDLTLRHDKRQLLLMAAQTLLEHHDAGRHCDREAVNWALQMIRANGRPSAVYVTPTATVLFDATQIGGS
jgi:hypothetical protein